MSLKGIVAVGGMSGLYKVISQTKSGYIVESLTDKKKTIVQSTQKVSPLEDITIYTTTGDKPLKDIFNLMKEKENVQVNPKSESAVLKTYFKTILPDYDDERVYASDIKKIVSWYELLKEILREDKQEQPGNPAEESKTEPGSVEEKPGTQPQE